MIRGQQQSKFSLREETVAQAYNTGDDGRKTSHSSSQGLTMKVLFALQNTSDSHVLKLLDKSLFERVGSRRKPCVKKLVPLI